MFHRSRITLLIVILLVATLLVLPGTMPTSAVTSAEPAASPMEKVAPVAPQQITCNSCADCSSKLSSGLYVTVTLSTNLTDQAGTCISLPLGESDVVFDCAGHTIDGDDQAIDPDQGIAMLHGSNNTIMNCTVSDFTSGIYLRGATYHTVVNNHVTSNGAGIDLSFAQHNDVRNNTVDENFTGILISDSDYNTIFANASCNNTNRDFYLVTGTGNSGDSNACDVPDGWNDQGTTGCRYTCVSPRVYLPLVVRGNY